MLHKIIRTFSIILLVLLTVGCSDLNADKTASPEPAAAEQQAEASGQTAAVQTAEAAAPVGSDSPCYNIFYPLVVGNQWVYRLNQEEAGVPTPEPGDTTDQVGISVSAVNENQATLDALNLASGVITQTVVQCEDGAIKNFPMLTLSLLIGDMASGSAQLDYLDGVFMPAESDFVDKGWVNDWSGNYTLRGNFQAQDEGDQVVFTISDSPLKLDWQTQGVKEAVEVPAGSFPDAVRVERQAEMNVSIQLTSGADAFAFDGVLTFKNTLWYAPHVGLLKEDIHDVSLTYRGMTFPVVVTGDLELVEFRPAE